MKNKIQLLDTKFQRSYPKEIVRKLIESNKFKEEENFILEYLVETNQCEKLFENKERIIEMLNEESFQDWLKDKATKAKEIVSKNKEKIKEKSINFLMKVGTNFQNLIKLIIDNIKEFLLKVWKFIKEQTYKLMGSHEEEMLEKIKKMNIKKNHLVEEIKNFKTMASGGIKYLTGGVLDDMSSALSEISNEQINENVVLYALAECINEDINFIDNFTKFDISESADSHTESTIPIISKIASKIGHLFPFNILHKIEDTVKTKTNNILHKISTWLTENVNIDGPFTFEIMGAIMALYVGLEIKSGLTDFIKEIGISAIGASILAVFPGITLILAIMKYIAKGLWITGIAETAVKAMT
jgi:hypothetical protein